MPEFAATPRKELQSSDTVLVVGGGLAGLAAARTVTDAGMKAIVLEAAPLLGGRCCQEVVGGVRCEVGAEFLHGGSATAKQLADAIGLPCERVFTTAHGDGGPDDNPAPDGSVGFYYVDGELLPHDSPRLAPLNRALGRLGELIVPKSDTRSLAAYLHDECVHDAGLIDLAKASYSNTLGVGDDLELLPLRAVARLERLWSEQDGDGDYRAAGASSLGPLISTLADGAIVLCNCAVTRLTRLVSGSACVSATCADGRSFDGAAAVIAVPLTALQHERIQFEPTLPEDKCAALRSIRMAEALKLLLVFRSSPWSRDGQARQEGQEGRPKVQAIITAGKPGEVIPEMWFRSSGQQWLASGFATGAYAARLADLGEADAIELMLKQLSHVLPGKVLDLPALRDNLQAAKLVDWSADGYVAGGYSAPSPGESDTTRAHYRRVEWCGKLGFAGEASEESMMTINAAITSGRRAAVEVIATVGAAEQAFDPKETWPTRSSPSTPRREAEGSKGSPEEVLKRPLREPQPRSRI